MSTFKLQIITPQKKYAERMIESLSLNTFYGQITVLAHHSDLIANVEISPVIIRKDGHVSHFACGGGVLNVDQKNNFVQLIVNSIESFDEIDLKRAIEEKNKAEKLLINSKSVKEYNEAEISLKKAINRINVKREQDI